MHCSQLNSLNHFWSSHFLIGIIFCAAEALFGFLFIKGVDLCFYLEVVISNLLKYIYLFLNGVKITRLCCENPWKFYEVQETSSSITRIMEWVHTSWWSNLLGFGARKLKKQFSKISIQIMLSFKGSWNYLHVLLSSNILFNKIS